MSLADLVPVATTARMPRRAAGAAARQRRWKERNRAAFNAMRRRWRQAVRERGGVPT